MVSLVAGTTRDDAPASAERLRQTRLHRVCTLATSRARGRGRTLPRGGPGFDRRRCKRQRALAIADADVILWCDPTGRFEHAAVGASWRRSPAGRRPVTSSASAPAMDLAAMGETARPPPHRGRAPVRLAPGGLRAGPLGSSGAASCDRRRRSTRAMPPARASLLRRRALAPRHARALEAALEQIDGRDRVSNRPARPA